MKRYLPIIPILCILTSFILLIISLTGQTTKSSVSLGVYTLKLDFRNLNFSELMPTDWYEVEEQELQQLVGNLTFNNSGLDEIYLIGTHGYCSGDFKAGGDGIDAKYCTPQGETEFFEPRTMILKAIEDANQDNALSTNLTMYEIQLPQGVPSFWFSGADPIYVRLIFYAILVGAILIGLELCCHIISLFTKRNRSVNIWLETLAYLFSFGGIILTLIGMVVSKSLMVDRTLKYMNDEEYGIVATLGNKRFYIMVWFAVALEILQFITIANIISCCMHRIAFRREPKIVPVSTEVPHYYRSPPYWSPNRKPVNRPPTYGGFADTNNFLRTPGVREERVSQLPHLATNPIPEDNEELPSYQKATGRPSTTNRARDSSRDTHSPV